MIDFTTNGRVALTTINRPEVRNAINGAVARGIEAAIDRLETDDTLWVGVMSCDLSVQYIAEGPQAFIEKRPPVWTGR
jgi:enoyl-CoA hydratase